MLVVELPSGLVCEGESKLEAFPWSTRQDPELTRSGVLVARLVAGMRVVIPEEYDVFEGDQCPTEPSRIFSTESIFLAKPDAKNMFVCMTKMKINNIPSIFFIFFSSLDSQ
jgi:hypothetical protein